MKIFKKFWDEQNSLEKKLFWSILVVVALASAGSAIFTVVEGMSVIAAGLGFGCTLVCFLVALVAVKTGLYNQCYLVMCCLLTCFLMPLLFLFCGGITSGMPLYYLTAIALITYASRGRARLIAFGISVLVDAGVFVSSWVYPDLVVAELDRDGAYLDILVSTLFTSLTLFVVGTFSMRAYATEREKNERLKEEVDRLSARDSLTEVYNRNYLANHLRNVVWHRRGEFYLLILNLDNFKKVNLQWGYILGDKVIGDVARLLNRFQDESCGECVARCGGETFVYVINAPSEGDAFAKADLVRKEIGQLRFDGLGDLSVTASGGFVSCNARKMENFKQVLNYADNLLKMAKELGKNQIRVGT